ncbi:dipeptidyl aminopeptidase/acylaminoacyl peptidase [Ereboglobus sp. PH5-10]|uniref:S9 family peptidase n=1 Tax=Ereboglobus sp. PH5-10 TaxID=2940629 RepID=UPI002405637F|nr:S9 family peptidase [Ereboglobus sp. PH5-10]MDF9826961.1 dipeptidyl aminopeptidase/acylaminoacyl peptidase [Ereboglobus sp. PH5-10]
MKKPFFAVVLALVLLPVFAGLPLVARVPANLVADGIPAIPSELRRDVSRYLEFRSAVFNGWHPVRRELLVTTRFAESAQLHLVRNPLGQRKQLTFLSEPVAGASYHPKTGDYILFSQDRGGGEFYQLYRYDSDGRITLLTDGKSRNGGGVWSHRGDRIAYTSTRRNGADNDVYIMDPADPARTDRMLAQMKGGGWRAGGWSFDDKWLLVREYISINESRYYVVDVASGKMELVTPAGEGVARASWAGAQFARDGKSIIAITDTGSEFMTLVRYDLATRAITPLTRGLRWDVERFEQTPDGKKLAYAVNEAGVSTLHFLDLETGRELPAPRIPAGVIGSMEWHANGVDFAFTLTSARSPADTYSINLATGALERWTESETGGLDAGAFVEPRLISFKSFDGLEISAFLYLPDSKKFPGPRPVLINIHGGPESQFRPRFLAQNNYYLNELGIAIVYPNVRGSSGYGKTFVSLDNGYKRADSVKDIGALLDALKADSRLDAGRMAVTGGSYGGFMSLSTMIHYGDRMRCGIDVVGISNFLTFLKNTQDYRRDLRRAEYGDERDPRMHAFLEQVSPTTSISKIKKPMLIVQGKNDPRVPASEAEQVLAALRAQGNQVWYLMANDEGHGFKKKANIDYQFLTTILFLRENLLGQ